MKYKTNKIAKKVIYIVGLFLFLVIIIFPFYWLLVTSVKNPSDINLMPTEIWPSRFSLEFYRSVFVDHHLQTYIFNSVVVSLGTMLLTILVAFPAAFAFARINFKFKKFWNGLILLANMFPLLAIVTPMFIIFRKLHLLNTYIGLILPSVILTLPMAIWTLSAFIETIPYELEEAAQIDGCRRADSILRIIFPLSGPGVFTTAIIAFISAWNEFTFALVLVTKDEMRTVPIAISMFPGEFTLPWGDMSAASIVSTGPIILLVLLFQKKIVSGLTSGAVKG
jgi:multiple sugar transport system permease protein